LSRSRRAWQPSARRQDTRLATISLTQRVASTELTASYTRWQSDVAAFGESGGAFQVGFRQRLSGGEPGSSRRARIAGHVYRDGEASTTGPTTVGVAGVTVRLGDGRTAVTDAGGNFLFEDVGRRGRRVEAVLPAPNAFFTTPSTVDVKDSAVVRFGLRFSDGRLDGRVYDDARLPVAGVTLRLTGTGAPASAVSDSIGRFVFNAAAGDYTLRLDPDSLPTGYEAAAPESRDLRISLSAPAHADFAVRVQRSLSGRVIPGKDGVEVRLRTAGRAVRTDDQGRFLFRYVAAGPDALEATVGGRVVTRLVEVSDAPASLHDLDLDGGAAPLLRGASPAAAAPVPPVAMVTPANGVTFRYFVQFAAHRDRATAARDAERVGRELGRPARVVVADLGSQGRFYRVLVGDFGSASDARRFRQEMERTLGSRAGSVHRVAVEPP
jgi:SPOR domain